MSDKHPELEPLKPGDEQLDPKKFDMHNMIANGIVKAFIEFLNDMDLDHDHKRDIVEYGPRLEAFVKEFMPILQKLGADVLPLVDVPKMVDHISSLPFIKDKELATKVLLELVNVAEKAAALAAK